MIVGKWATPGRKEGTRNYGWQPVQEERRSECRTGTPCEVLKASEDLQQTKPIFRDKARKPVCESLFGD